MDLRQKEEIEINYWRDSSHENPEVFTKGNLLNKMKEARIFEYKVIKHHSHFKDKKRVLELGAGQGWASAWLKKYYLPQAHFTVSDISSYALMSVKYWEKTFDVELDEKIDCRSYRLPFEDNSYDLVFCFAAAHHFIKHEETLAEVKRVLRKGGSCIFLNEPVCSKFLYKFHYKHVNNHRQVVPEDVIVPSEFGQLADKVGLKFDLVYDTKQLFIRSIFSSIYYKVLSRLKFLQRLLPNSADLILTKP